MRILPKFRGIRVACVCRERERERERERTFRNRALIHKAQS